VVVAASALSEPPAAVTAAGVLVGEATIPKCGLGCVSQVALRTQDVAGGTAASELYIRYIEVAMDAPDSSPQLFPLNARIAAATATTTTFGAAPLAEYTVSLVTGPAGLPSGAALRLQLSSPAGVGADNGGGASSGLDASCIEEVDVEGLPADGCAPGSTVVARLRTFVPASAVTSTVQARAVVAPSHSGADVAPWDLKRLTLSHVDDSATQVGWCVCEDCRIWTEHKLKRVVVSGC
jgi:hypothetical protein